MELEADLAAGVDLPFDEIVSCNIGNPQALQQAPLSYVRDVLAMVLRPPLMEARGPLGRRLFAPDAVAQAREYLAKMPGAGAYSNSQGLMAPRQQVARFIGERDGHACSPDTVFLTDGASEGVRYMYSLLVRDAEEGFNDGIMCPIPQYPLYSALTTLQKGTLVPYYLDESQEWATTAAALEAALRKARREGVTVRALVVINPGNPTGQVLSVEDMRGIVDLCVREGLILCADEVYQENVWEEGKEFVSFRKVAIEMGYTGEEEITKPGEGLQLVSFHSVSKGFLGECGLRGGYFQVHGIPAAAAAQVYKLASISLCSNTVGQLTTGLMCALPRPGSPSFKKFARERDAILGSMRRRAGQLGAALNRLEGVSCNSAQGAMYVFPRITLPRRAVAAAAAEGVAPDAFYCMRLLEATGIIVVPGSGFGQQEGTWHFRTTFLPSEARMAGVVDRLARFHAAFMDQYRDD